MAGNNMKRAIPLPVTVIVPTHNRSAVLRRALRSVLAQTCSPAEVIVVDDASREDIAGLVASFGDSRLRYLRQERQGGPGLARNAGVEAAQTDWIAFQDSDDEWLINKLELQWQAADHGRSDAGLICGAYAVVPRKGSPLLVGPTAAMQGRQWSARARFDFPFIAPTWMFRRSTFQAVGGFDTTLPNLEDWELAFRLHDAGGFVALPDVLLVKHGSADGLNKDFQRQAESLRRIRLRHAPLFDGASDIGAELALRRARAHGRLKDAAGTRLALREAWISRPGLQTTVLYGASLLGLRMFHLVQRVFKSLEIRT